MSDDERRTRRLPRPSRSVLLGVAVVLLIGLGAGYNFGAAGSSQLTETHTASVTTTTTASYVSFLTQTQERIETQTTTATSVSVATEVVTSIVNQVVVITTTSVTTTTQTRTLGSGITIQGYKLWLSNVAPDSVLKLNVTILFPSAEYTSVVEQATVILTPSNGNANDIKFVPNPITAQVSDYILTLSMYTIIDHQIAAGTYLIEYSISTSQGGGLIFTVLEVTR